MLKTIINLQVKNLRLPIIVLLIVPFLSFGQEKEIKIVSSGKVDFIPFHAVENVPYPSDCKELKTNAEKKKCVSEYIQRHTMRKFDTELISNLGLEPGKKRIFVQFKFDKSGKVFDVKARATHPKLEEEAIRVVQLIPQFAPGVHQDNEVIVAYSLPIVFVVEEVIKTKTDNN